MDDGRDRVRSEHGIEGTSIANVAFDEAHPALVNVGDAADTLDNRAAAVRKVVGYDHLVAGRKQLDAGVRADGARAAGDQDGLLHALAHTTKLPQTRENSAGCHS